MSGHVTPGSYYHASWGIAQLFTGALLDRRSPVSATPRLQYGHIGVDRHRSGLLWLSALVKPAWGVLEKWRRRAHRRGVPTTERPDTVRGAFVRFKKLPMFREAFQHRRALILATGFFEWHDGKQP